jgi:hypothetical protein
MGGSINPKFTLILAIHCRKLFEIRSQPEMGFKNGKLSHFRGFRIYKQHPRHNGKLI